MFGLEDPWIYMAYLLCILGTVFCVVYGALNWNKGDEPVYQEDEEWLEEEIRTEEEL